MLDHNIIIIILEYFDKRKEKYDLEELRDILDFTWDELDTYVTYMKEKEKLLTYKDNLLTITPNGQMKLVKEYIKGNQD
jgi:hypothetical protein